MSRWFLIIRDFWDWNSLKCGKYTRRLSCESIRAIEQHCFIASLCVWQAYTLHCEQTMMAVQCEFWKWTFWNLILCCLSFKTYFLLWNWFFVSTWAIAISHFGIALFKLGVEWFLIKNKSYYIPVSDVS